MIGGKPNGHLHGKISSKDETITGNNISYIYPDMNTVLLGRFENSVMKDAQQATVIELDCDDNGLLYVSKYSKPDQYSPHFYYEPASNVSYGAGPPGVLDPYEEKWLALREATDPNMGQGIYALKDFKEGELVASYHGFVFGKSNGQFEIYNKNCGMNVTKSNDERRQCLKYSINLEQKDAKINIPPQYDKPGMFIPSLGPKVCHFLVTISYTIKNII